MAKIKLGAIVTDIRNKLGGHVFSKNRAGAYMRTLVTPVNPQTSAQSAVRSIFAQLSQTWSQLSDPQRAAWNGATDQYSSTDIFGDNRTLSGKALFQGLNQNLQLVGESVIYSPGSPNELDLVGTFAPDYNTTTNALTTARTDENGVSYVQIYASGPVTAGTNFVKNKMRLILSVPGDDSPITGFQAAYEAKFGTIANSQKIFIGQKFINSGDGNATPLETRQLTFSA